MRMRVKGYEKRVNTRKVKGRLKLPEEQKMNRRFRCKRLWVRKLAIVEFLNETVISSREDSLNSLLERSRLATRRRRKRVSFAVFNSIAMWNNKIWMQLHLKGWGSERLTRDSQEDSRHRTSNTVVKWTFRDISLRVKTDTATQSSCSLFSESHSSFLSRILPRGWNCSFHFEDPSQSWKHIFSFSRRRRGSFHFKS